MKKDKSELWEKYWSGESSLEEENLLFGNPGDLPVAGPEKSFRKGIVALRGEKPKAIPKPYAGLPWQRLAAGVALLCTIAACWWGYESYREQQRKQAYLQVVAAMELIQEQLQRGSQELENVENLKYLNTGADWYEINNQHQR
ncbi:hypothetical protein SAMN04488057_102459 [Cyclobacterium lianum]|uniref:Uncharacterized protein n=1 Tax=Cyclobacterium lianum TaxID=388280 RepID=A0A1M7KH39_9BACT|nr:hypothetical protein [Cyclobacterium lianum]SHM64608.1 hypothetical protein SAMN04488057_102459 [Cyclobacterium lianum]